MTPHATTPDDRRLTRASYLAEHKAEREEKLRQFKRDISDAQAQATDPDATPGKLLCGDPVMMGIEKRLRECGVLEFARFGRSSTLEVAFEEAHRPMEVNWEKQPR